MNKADELDDLCFGEEIDWKTLRSPESYYPTRLEYFAGKIVMAMIQGRSEKDWRRCLRQSVELAQQLEEEIDTANKERD